ncbi:MAG: histidine phosphatase family protein [Planctomycetota bacterium]|nr:histidine phosphatase family protein [Planctomycetota bacterium]
MKEFAPGQAFTGSFDAATQKILPADWATHVHLLRHGEVAALTDRVVRGQMDAALSPRGVEQGEQLARWLAGHEPAPSIVWSSDLVRCRGLAERIARDHGVPLRIDPRLREQSMGAWEGRTWAQITAAEPAAVTAYWEDYYTARPTRGESFADMETRANAWWNDIQREHRGERIQVVTHVGVIRALLCRALGVPGSQALRFAPAMASHTLVAQSEAGAVVSSIGERPWLFGDDAPSVRPPGSGVVSVVSAGSARPRIAISGSAGTGKTTLGKRLASDLGVPFVEEGMRRRIEAGFRPHGYGAREWAALMRDLWEEHRAGEDAAAGGFVADRSSLDFAAFWLHYGLHEDVEATERFVEEMRAHAARYDRIVLLPWGALPLVDDGVRSTNRWTQLRYHSILEGLLDRMAPERVLRLSGGQSVLERLALVRGAASDLSIRTT